MTEYILLIHARTATAPADAEWGRFITAAKASGMFRGGSEIGRRVTLGNPTAPASSHLAGYMLFETDDHAALLKLLQDHPVLVHGGTVELCETPRS
jgi:hypothetical protein